MFLTEELHIIRKISFLYDKESLFIIQKIFARYKILPCMYRIYRFSFNEFCGGKTVVATPHPEWSFFEWKFL